MPDSALIQAALSFRSALLARERKAAMRLVVAYSHIWDRLHINLAKVTADIQDARARGEIVNQFWLSRQQRYADLLRQTEHEISKFSDFSNMVITNGQRAAAVAGLSDSVALMETATESVGLSVTFNKLPVAAVENLIGTLGNGSPLRSLLDQLPRAGRQIVEQGLIEGVALGRNPVAIARTIREGLGGNMTRALTISRTEVLRSYRESSLRNYQQNSNLVSGWTWRSGRSARSCMACIALDGTFHPLSEPMRPHGRCRCTLIPSVQGVKVDRGVDWFEEQDAQMQRDIIGTDKGYEAFKRGELKPEDFVGKQSNPLWGDSYHQLSVKRALAGESQFPE